MQIISAKGAVIAAGVAEATDKYGWSVIVWADALGRIRSNTTYSVFSWSLNDGMNSARLRVREPVLRHVRLVVTATTSIPSTFWCVLQVFNMLNRTVLVNGVTANCWDCRLPNLCNIAAETALSSSSCVNITVRDNYLVLDSSHDYQLQMTGLLGHNDMVYEGVLDQHEYSVLTAYILPSEPICFCNLMLCLTCR